MKKKIIYISAIIILTGYLTCKKAFNPTLATTYTNFLAVDGPIISGDSTLITLSRTTSLSDTTQKKPELRAIISVEDDQHTIYALKETGSGNYVLGVTNFSTSRQYRLDIKTADGQIYQSDFVAMKVTPPIDSLYYKQTGAQTINFYANTHDASNNTRYYRWDYKETWSYVAAYAATYQYKNGSIFPIVPRSINDISTCYQSDGSSEIFVASSAALANDIILAQPLGALTGGSVKIAHLYALQLRQYALTFNGFNYYQNLKSNTEQLGTIFDAQPSTTGGNIHCITTPGQLVLGFVSVSTVSGKQCNLRFNDLQFQILSSSKIGMTSINYFPPPDLFYCSIPGGAGSVLPSGIPWTFFAAPAANYSLRLARTLAKGDSLVISADASPDSTGVLDVIKSFTYAPKSCVDCRLKGGTNIRPSYFPLN